MDAYVQGAQRTVDRVVGELGERDGGLKVDDHDRKDRKS